MLSMWKTIAIATAVALASAGCAGGETNDGAAQGSRFDARASRQAGSVPGDGRLGEGPVGERDGGRRDDVPGVPRNRTLDRFQELAPFPKDAVKPLQIRADDGPKSLQTERNERPKRAIRAKRIKPV